MLMLGTLGVRAYPAPLLIARAKDLGLTPEQVTKLRQEILTTQSRAIDVRAKIEHTKLEAVRLLSADKVDERGVHAQIDEGAKAQAELHKLHVDSMLRVRAILTPEQQKKLEERRRPRAGKPRMAPAMGPLGQVDDDDDDDDDADDDREG